MAFVDADAATLELAQSTLGLPPERCFPSLEAALARVEAEAAVLTVFIAGHVPVAITALEAGLHVLVEKPFAPSVAEALPVVERAEALGKTLMVSQNYRFYPAARKATALL